MKGKSLLVTQNTFASLRSFFSSKFLIFLIFVDKNEELEDKDSQGLVFTKVMP